MYKKILISLILLVSSAQAHTAIMSCFDNGDENIVCEGGFSDGSSASGILFFIKQIWTKIRRAAVWHFPARSPQI